MITQFAITQALEALHYKRNRIEELRQKLPKDLQAEIESLTASLQLTCKAIAEIENSLAKAPKNKADA